MAHQRLTLQARGLYEAIDAAIPADLNVEGKVTPGEENVNDVDLCRPELDRAFDLIDEVLAALDEYERSQS